MGSHNYDAGTLTIANAAAVSGTLAANPHFTHAKRLTFYLPATLTQAALKVQVSDDGGTTFFNLLDEQGNGVTGAASDAVTVPMGGWDACRVGTVGGGNEGAERTINVTAFEEM